MVRPYSEYASRNFPVFTRYAPRSSKIWTARSVGRFIKLLNRRACIDAATAFGVSSNIIQPRGKQTYCKCQPG